MAIKTSTVENAFNKAKEKYSTPNGVCRYAALLINKEHKGWLKDYTPAMAADMFGEYVLSHFPDENVKVDDVAKFMNEAKNVIRQGVFRSSLSEIFGLKSPWKASDELAIITAIEKCVPSFTKQKKGKTVSYSLAGTIAAQCGIDENTAADFCSHVQSKISEHLDLRSVREKKEEIDTSEFDW